MQGQVNLPVVLLVDDAQDTLDYITIGVDVFKPKFRVETASTGEEAIRKMNEKHYDAVILDVALPGMTGSMVADVIRRSNKEIPMAFLTGYSGQSLHQNAEEFNAQFWSKKEVLLDFEQVITHICGLLGNTDCAGEPESLEIREGRRAVESYKIPKFMTQIARALR